jgi:hypothetical protein
VKKILDFFKKRDNVFTLVMILLFLVALVLFFQYEGWLLEPRIRESAQREKAGVATESKNARRRYSGSLTYFDLQKNGSIFVGDTIFTNRQARVELHLTDDSKIRLGELTLVIIDKDKDHFRIFLAAGEISGELAANSKIEFNVEDERIELSAEKRAEFKIQNTKMGETKLEGGKGKIKANFRLKELELGNEEKKSEVVNSGTSAVDVPPPKPTPTLAPTGRPVAGALVELNELPLDLPIPSPPERHVFLIKEKGDVIIVPAKKCEVDCEIFLRRDGFQVGFWKFKKGQTPVVRVFFAKSDYGQYQVVLSESETFKEILTSQFELRVFSKFEFENTLRGGLSVEIMD